MKKINLSAHTQFTFSKHGNCYSDIFTTPLYTEKKVYTCMLPC